MRFTILILGLLVLSACAKGYREGQPLRGKDLVLAQKASDLAKKVDQLDETIPSALASSWKGFAENVKLFDNNCQRKSCNSLEARNDFNHLRYYATQVDSLITQNAYPELHSTWQTIRKDYVDSIGKELGYRID
jgi:hypothetical protein